MTQPIFTSGLQNPNTGHYVGDFGSTPDGQHYIERADDSLVISFTDAPLEGFTVPVDGSLETAQGAIDGDSRFTLVKNTNKQDHKSYRIQTFLWRNNN